MGSYPSGANGYARVDAQRPVAFAICDRCGFRYSRSDLVWQFQWQGAQIQNQRILVCRRTCLDELQEQLRSYSPPPDPLPVRDPRPDQSVMGGPIIVTTMARASSQLLPLNLFRNYMALEMPASFGIWINQTGGSASPGSTGAVFYAPGSAINIIGAAAASHMTYWSYVAGLTLVVEVDSGTSPQPTPPEPVFITVNTPVFGVPGNPQLISGTYIGGPPVHFTYSLDGGADADVASPTIGGGVWSFTIVAPPSGVHTIAVTAS